MTVDIISYNEFLKTFKNVRKVLVLGKGKLSNKLPKKGYDLYVGVKQSIGILKQKDILVMNDFEGFFGLENCLKEIKYILMPNKPHFRQKPDFIAKQYAFEYLKKYNFNGKIMFYELGSNKERDPSLFFLKKNINSGDIIFSFLELANKKMQIDIFGIYKTTEENDKITNLILNAKPELYKDIYKDYLKRVYKDKKKMNETMFHAANCSFFKKNIDHDKKTKDKYEILQILTKKNYKGLLLNFH